MISISYNKLWKLLIDRGMNRHDLMVLTGISSASVAKLGRSDNVTTDVLLKICNGLSCKLEDILESVELCVENEKEKQ